MLLFWGACFVLLAIFITSGSMTYNGPTEEGGFFPIGWSEKGDVFAYGYYVGSNISQDMSHMVVRIQNMINDSILFRYASERRLILTLASSSPLIE